MAAIEDHSPGPPPSHGPGSPPLPEGRFARSWFFVGRCWELFRSDSSLKTVAAVATVLNALAGALVFGGAVWLTGSWSPRLEAGVSGAVLAFPVTVISTFCNVALLRMAQARFDGRHCTAADGFRAAWARMPAILAWSLLAVGVGAVLDELAKRVPFFGALTAWLFGVAWSLATMFAVPVLAVEDAGARRAARRSAEVFRERWGEGVIGTVSVDAVTAVGSIPGLFLVLIGIAAGGGAGIGIVVVGAVLLMAALTVGRALNAMFALAVYRDQVQGQGSLGLSGGQINDFIKLKDRKLRRRRGRGR